MAWTGPCDLLSAGQAAHLNYFKQGGDKAKQICGQCESITVQDSGRGEAKQRPVRGYCKVPA